MPSKTGMPSAVSLRSTAENGNGSTTPRNNQSPIEQEKAEEIAWTLLRRYGVVSKRLLEREAMTLPLRVLLRLYHRLEARGEIRGGRFVAGISGEQFALPEAVGMLRAIRREGTLSRTCARGLRRRRDEGGDSHRSR